MADELDAALGRLRTSLAEHDVVYVAFSGGADSAFLAAVAHEVLGPERAVAVTAVSPSLAALERDDCQAFTSELGMRWIEVETDEMEQVAYRRNDGDRCYWCKDALMRAVLPIAEDGAVVALGVNLDDLGDHRPGQRAAAEAGAAFPLVDAGFTKAMVREASRRMGLPTWDKPAAACLASRIPYGTSVSVAVLGRVERAERALRAMGFDALRVRHYDDTARLEVPVERFDEVVARAEEVVAAVEACGYRYVTLDLAGLRSGNLNQALG
ncbi:ATP-dependent sacrificial sulfur transferase LarE [Actinomarinicola tropica]|uniref:ATP-dependent sacrificial sulfur transferase LarE n=1 Tax=Actinomarinicola tropica TaxID=2789776 RepID=A0A5Q2RPR4_9ACTN|nr:ATP-dependent sacrificial sulfur transferase LarE [Actinomarinicola tropica]QGG96436.1 ATP-dependent sacrificial sulfur transferase LarE [Actinomarinicola tropica]